MPRDMVHVRRGGSHRFSGPDVKIGRSQFNRSHGLKTTFDVSYLYPIFCDEVLPGDTMTLKTHGFCRVFSPLESPIMDNIEVETLFFFVPNRLVWQNWEYFQGAHDAAGAQDTTYTVPVMGNGVTVDHDENVAVAGLMAHFGIPEGLQTTQVGVNSLPFRGYNRIFNDWFRDQNVGAEVTMETGNGPDTTGNYAIRKSAKRHDYFTSSLPYLQKGDIKYLGQEVVVETDVAEGGNPSVYSTVSSNYRQLDAGAAQVDTSATLGSLNTALKVDLAGVTGISINALRESLAIQRLLERDARGGTRYTEIIKSHFGVTSPDFRLQRTEYLGGGKAFVNVAPVANTSATATEDQGELRGVGTGRVTGGFARSFTEHGYIIGLIRARGDVTYFQGLDRHWSRSDRYDFYMPDLANLGEQSILNKELYISNSSATDDAVFAYQERWAEYRTKKSEIHGKFNPDVSGSLSIWHLAEDFGSLPTLNNTFIQDQTPMSRVTVVDSEPDFIADLWFDYRCARPMPVRSIPSILGGRF